MIRKYNFRTCLKFIASLTVLLIISQASVNCYSTVGNNNVIKPGKSNNNSVSTDGVTFQLNRDLKDTVKNLAKHDKKVDNKSENDGGTSDNIPSSTPVNSDEIKVVSIKDHKRLTSKLITGDWDNVVLLVIFLTTTFSVIVLTISRIIENKVDDTQDTFLKNAFDVCFKQIALISVINLVLWLILQTRLAKKLDSLIFKQAPSLYNEDDTESLVESVFECLLYISIILLLWYILYAIYFQYAVRRIIKWLRMVDDLDILTTSKELEFLERNCCASLWNRRVLSGGRFISNRFEFIDTINNLCVPKVDPGGYYFMEYLRANLLDLSVNMLRLPPEALFFVMIISFISRSTLEYQGVNEVILICDFSIICVITLASITIHVTHIEHQLYPAKLSQYLLLKYNLNDTDPVRNNNVVPVYRLNDTAVEVTNPLIKLICGDYPINNHENLFIFKNKGPRILLKSFEIVCYSFLILLSVWVYLVQEHQETWLVNYVWSNYLMGGCIIFFMMLLPNILYSLIVVTKTGMMIDLSTLERVWESHKSNNAKHAMELIDALNLDAVITSIDKNGDTYWRHLLAKVRTSPLALQKQMQDVWNSLDSKRSGYIDMPKLMRYLSSQGVQITCKKRIKDFIRAFTRTVPYKLTEEEFLVLGLIIKQITVIPLDQAQMKILFEETYCIPWTSPCGIDSDNLQNILKHLGIKWSEGDRRHLLDFLSGGRCNGMSAESFIGQLASIEQLLYPENYQNLTSKV